MLASLLTLLATATQPSGGEALRVIPSLVLTAQGEVELRIENPSPRPLDTSLMAELVLAPPERAPRSDIPVVAFSYHARLDLRDVEVRPSDGRTRLQVVANGSRTWVSALCQLKWYEKVGATRSADRPFRHGVRPGHYRLTLWLEKDDSQGWVSQELQVTIDNAGRLSLQATEPQ